MKLSVIIPVYNAQDTIKKCVDSVVGGSQNEYEIILVDDGSTDQSLKICQEYLTLENVSVISKDNGGVSSARNAGLEVASGDYILFLDSDDWLEEGAVGVLMEYMHSEKDLYVFGIKRIKNGIEVGRCAYVDCVGCDKTEIMISLFMKNQFGFVCAKMIKRSLIEAQKLCFDESLKMREDQDYMLRLWGRVQSVSCIEAPLYCYNQRSNSAMQIYNKKVLEHFAWFVSDLEDNLNHIESFMVEEGVEKTIRDEYRKVYAYSVLHNAMNVLHESPCSFEQFLYLTQSDLAATYLRSPIQKKGKAALYELALKAIIRYPNPLALRVMAFLYKYAQKERILNKKFIKRNTHN